jgi:hypothetical protein
VGDGEKLLTYLNSALKVLLGLDIFSCGPKKKLNFVDQPYHRIASWDVTPYILVNIYQITPQGRDQSCSLQQLPSRLELVKTGLE